MWVIFFPVNPGFSTVTEQVAHALREGLRQGRWQGTMPGRIRLAAELGVNHKTVKAALGILERDGLLEAHGPGRKRSILRDVPAPPVMCRVMVLLYEKSDLHTDYLVKIIHRLQEAGHWAGFANKTLRDLGMDVNRVARFVAKTDADAWVVVAASKVIIEWFAAQALPAFALFGRASRVSIASAAPDKTHALLELVDRLVGLGHRRIMMLAREDRRKPSPGMLEMTYLARLETHGIRTGPYNLPDWGNDPDALGKSLGSLFRHTPPSALIVDDALIFPAVVQQLARLGISAPQQISLACMDYSETFEWYRPAVTHIAWNHAAVISRVADWAKQMSSGKTDRRRTQIRATLVPGGTIGPVPQDHTEIRS
jgi:DNA-binding LacI/PurR family transcriptional regulator/DNA-binding transcriptional regulator YhcF (GntR family)